MKELGFSTGPTYVTLFVDHDPYDYNAKFETFQEPCTEAMRDFIAKFDNGEYPELVKKED